MPSSGRSSQSPEEVDAARHRLADLLDTLSTGELPVVSDTKDNRERIAEHSFSVNGDR